MARGRAYADCIWLGVTPLQMVTSSASRDREVRVRIASSADIVTARQCGRVLAERAGFSSSHLAVIATAIAEVATNIVDYAKEGEIVLRVVSAANRRGVHIIASDSGPGIADIGAAMRDGHCANARLSIGLSGSRRLMDEFDIASELGRGTTVTMTKWLA
jgi:serine/threonine-protein kinase RsbT